MRTFEAFLAEYEKSHRHPINRLIHKVAVPAILGSLLMILWGLQWATFALVNAATVSSFFYALFALRLAPKHGKVLLGLLLGFNLASFFLETRLTPLWAYGLAVFVIAWIAQFIGHRIEGKRPSFFTDLLFLLIGPLWTIHQWLR